MSRLFTIFLPVALLLGACDAPEAAVDDADDAEVTERVADGEGARQGRRGLARLDLDQDGAISRDEAKDHRIAGKFDRLDADKDGKLTRDELAAMKGKRGERGHRGDPAQRAAKLLKKFDSNADGVLVQSELQGRFADKFAALDADRDGKLTQTELAAMKGKHGKRGHHGDPAQRAAKLLQKFDADKDGALAQSELQGRFADKFASLDADKDGKLTRTELAAMKGKHGKRGKHGDPAQRATRLLQKFDADKDGVLAQSELQGRFADRFASLDADRDGKLTRTELAAIKGKHGERGHHGDPAQRAARVMQKLDSNADGALSQDEVKGRRLEGKFAVVDADRDGKLTRDELVAFKSARKARGEGEAKAG